MGIDTKQKLLGLSITKNSFTMVPLTRTIYRNSLSTLAEGQQEKISGSKSISGILVQDPASIIRLTDSTYQGSDFILNQIALGCLYLMTQSAHAEFPGTTAGHPSSWVRINLSYEGVHNNRNYLPYCSFPIDIRQEVWVDAIVPVIEDPTLDPKIPINSNREKLLFRLTGVLNKKLQEKGYLP